MKFKTQFHEEFLTPGEKGTCHYNIVGSLRKTSQKFYVAQHAATKKGLKIFGVAFHFDFDFFFSAPAFTLCPMSIFAILL